MKKKYFWQFLVFGLICMGVYLSAGESDQFNENENLKQVEDRLRVAVSQCFSIEGEYPRDLDYLKENYKVFVDEKKYHVSYLYQGANIKPEILVMRKDTEYEK